jgi:hypothetical protein
MSVMHWTALQLAALHAYLQAEREARAVYLSASRAYWRRRPRAS